MNSTQCTVLGLLAVALLLSFTGRKGPGRALTYLKWLILAAAALLTLMPFGWLLAAAFKDPSVTMTYTFLPPIHLWASKLNLENFRILLQPQPSLNGSVSFLTYVANSLFLASAHTVIALFFCALGGYALAKFDFHGKKPLQLFMLGTLMVPHMLFLAPVYRMMFHLGWLDTWAAILVPGSVSAFGIFLFRQAITQVPTDIMESARIDGASEFRIWWQHIMPLIRPMTAAFCLIDFLASWNSFIAPQIYLTSQELLTLPVALNQMLGTYNAQYGVFLAGTVIAIIPPAILFFALQKEFVSGLTSGSVKG